MMQPGSPAVKTVIRIVNLRSGDYKVLSSDGVTWYYPNVVAMSCTCKAGANHFRSCRHDGMCRHLRTAKMLARVAHDRYAATQFPASTSGAPGLMEAFGA
jgi:hypothetical protein